VREAAIAAGAWGCVISGAGPSILALASRDCATAVSRAMVRAWESEGVASRAEVLQLQQAGSRWQPLPDA
jgi:homoserine kinase